MKISLTELSMQYFIFYVLQIITVRLCITLLWLLWKLSCNRGGCEIKLKSSTFWIELYLIALEEKLSHIISF